MSRTLNDDFEDDDGLGGSLDLEKGSQTGAVGGVGAGASSYDGGIDFDDDSFADDVAGAPLELDLPHGGPTSGPRSGAPGSLPDLPLGPPPPRVSGTHSAVKVQAAPQTMAAPGSAPAILIPSSSHTAAANPAGNHAEAEPPPAQSQAPAGHVPIPASTRGPAYSRGRDEPGPSRPTAGSVIAKYPAPPAEVWRAPKYAIQVILRQYELRSDLESLRRRRSPDVPLYESALSTYDPKTFRLGLAINIALFTVATFIFFLPVILRFVRAD